MDNEIIDGDGVTTIRLPATFDFTSREWFLDIFHIVSL